MNGEVLSKIELIIMFIVVIIAEVYLSHQNGKDFGAASKNLSSRFHLSEKMLRTGAHIGFFAVMIVAVWAVLDEVTKPLLKNGRHCSTIDIGWNLIGAAAGYCVG